MNELLPPPGHRVVVPALAALAALSALVAAGVSTSAQAPAPHGVTSDGCRTRRPTSDIELVELERVASLFGLTIAEIRVEGITTRPDQRITLIPTSRSCRSVAALTAWRRSGERGDSCRRLSRGRSGARLASASRSGATAA
jgi:hypothetical protein